ncbi:MAG: hypothetical protein WCY09_08565 [Candidatus Omnitrophota bacterium]
MGSYLGYREKPVNYLPDWTEAGENLAGQLYGEIERREKTKAEIEQSSRNLQKALDNVPVGEHSNLNQIGHNFADNIKQTLLSAKRELTNGRMKPKDYKILFQNLADGTDKSINLIKNYNKIFDEASKRRQLDENGNPTSQYIEQYNMGRLEQFGDLSKSILLIDKRDGTVNLALKDEKGNILPTSVTSLNGALAMASRQYNFVDEKKNIAEAIKKNIADKIKVIAKGRIATWEDAMDEKRFPEVKRFIDDYKRSILGNWHRTANILTEFVKSDKLSGKPYDYTDNEEEAKKDGSKLFLGQDPNNASSPEKVLKASDAQKKAVEDWIDNTFKTGLKNAQTMEPYHAPTGSGVANEKKKKDAEVLTVIMKGLTGNINDRNVLASKIQNLYGFYEVDVNETGLSYTDKDITNTIEFAGKTPAQILHEMTILTGIDNPEQVAKEFGINLEGTISKGKAQSRAQIAEYTPESFTEGAIKPDGSETPSPESIFDNTVSDGGMLTNRNNANFKKSYINGSTQVLSQLPRKVRKGLSVFINKEGENPVLKINLPSISDKPISIPITEATDEMKQKVKAKIEEIYDIAASGGQYNGEEPTGTTEKSNLGKWGKYAR